MILLTVDSLYRCIDRFADQLLAIGSAFIMDKQHVSDNCIDDASYTGLIPACLPHRFALAMLARARALPPPLARRAAPLANLPLPYLPEKRKKPGDGRAEGGERKMKSIETDLYRGAFPG